MANKKQIKQALNQYFSIKDIQEKETFKNRVFLNIEEEYTRYGDVI